LHTDASALGFSAVLLQKQENNAFASIAHFSQATTDVEKKYHSYDLETLAIVKAISYLFITRYTF
jgi:hypothetical protein